MNKPLGIKCANIYLRFPEIMEEEANELADFLENEHIVYEGATDVFIDKDNEIDRLNNIINELEKWLNIQLTCSSTQDYGVYKISIDKLKELKEKV